jgi:hypothetical protein
MGEAMTKQIGKVSVAGKEQRSIPIAPGVEVSQALLKRRRIGAIDTAPDQQQINVARIAAILIKIANENRVGAGQQNLIAKYRTTEMLCEAHNPNPEAPIGRGTNQNIRSIGRNVEGSEQGLHLPGNTGFEVAGMEHLGNQAATFFNQRNLNNRRSNVDGGTGGGQRNVCIQSHTISLMSVNICR